MRDILALDLVHFILCPIRVKSEPGSVALFEFKYSNQEKGKFKKVKGKSN